VGTLGWRDCGYHLGIELVDDHYEALLGRPFDDDGAHCYQDGMNRIGLGVCLVGNFDQAAPSPVMLAFTARHLRAIMSDLAIPVDGEHVRMHRQHATYKTCPGELFPYDSFLKLLREG